MLLRGTIRSLNADKGFGFLQPEGGGEDLFFHCSAVEADFTALELEQSVEYEVDPAAEKPRAKRVVGGSLGGAPKAQGASRGYEGKSPGVRGRVAPERGRSRSIGSRPEPDYEFGYVTKLPRKNPIGFISSTKGGAEFYFEPKDVRGIKFEMLHVGDYVRFVAMANASDRKQPLAKSVEVVPKPLPKDESRLARHPKARRRKPTWRS